MHSDSNLQQKQTIMNLFLKNSVQLALVRSVHLSRVVGLKEIVATENGNVTVVEGKYIQSPREPLVVKQNHQGKNCCIICSLGLDVKHTDVLILSQFQRSDGCMLPRRVTGLCCKQQKRIGTMVAMAQKAGILFPPGSKGDTSKRETYKKFNTYFDESTIKTYGW